MMKIFSAVVSVVCLLTLPIVIESCCMASSCGCGDNNFPTSFDIKDIKMNTVLRGNYPDAPIKDSLRLVSLELRLELEIENLAHVEKSFTPTMAAFACDPVTPTSDEFLMSYTVESDNELMITGKTFAAGEDLSSIFSLTGIDQMELPSRVYQRGVALVSDHETIKKADHIFTVKLVFGNGRTYEFETKRFRLIPQ